MHQTILIIEDDQKIADLIQLYLNKEDFRTIQANNGREGLEHALQVKPDLIILDRMLPEMEGLEVLKKVRAEQNVPVLIVSAKSDEIERIIGLEVGADDYLSKPFSPKELVARVKAILRRSHSSIAHDQKALQYKNLSLDPEKFLVLQNDKPIALSALEFKLLHYFVKHPGRVFTREQLMSELYDSSLSLVFDRTIDAHIKNLRKKLKDHPKKPNYISSVFGVGYKLLDA
jgi:two-component system, OmpR family, alkaline phosphatase synthesis response regulator PhoP